MKEPREIGWRGIRQNHRRQGIACSVTPFDDGKAIALAAGQAVARELTPEWPPKSDKYLVKTMSKAKRRWKNILD